MIKRLLAVVFLAGGSCAAWADEAVIRKSVETFLGTDGKAKGISPPGVLGLHEVRIATRPGTRIPMNTMITMAASSAWFPARPRR